MFVQIDYKNIKNKLSEQLSDTGWDVVDRYIFSNEFQTCLEYLVNDVNNGKRFTPKVKYFFRAFEECKHDNTKVIIVGQDPYPNLIINNNIGINAADGLAFSNSLTGVEQSSLTKIFNELEKIYPDYNRNTDLTRWANQGVLLLNTALSTQINKIGTHYTIWKPFVSKVVKYINDNLKDVIFVFMGKKAKDLSKFVNQHHVLYCEHPAAAAYNKRNWRSNNIFLEVNNKLKKFSKQEIIW
jgi:uracil-DNA glycosylase